MYQHQRRGRSPESRARSDAATRRGQAERQSYIDALKDRPCVDCGGRFPLVCMQFDHLPGGEKRFNLGHGRYRSIEAIDAEVAKCEVVCANCHAVRTSSRL